MRRLRCPCLRPTVIPGCVVTGTGIRHAAMIALAVCAVLFPGMATGADTQGRVSGTITDSSRAVIPLASVAARNLATGVEQRVEANRRGFYAFTSLPVGQYEIVIRRPGFTTYRRTRIVVNLNSALQMDAMMRVGTSRQSVTVSESSAHVESSSTQLGQVITGKEMRALPLNKRSYTDLLSLQPGVVPQTTIQPNSVVMTGVNTSIAPSGDLNPGNLSISGMREFANGFILNGSNVEESVNMGTAVVPNLDSISEFRILTSNFDAEYGDYAGGQIIVATKSGTNALHGGIFEFFRNTDLDSRSFFSPQRAEYNQNQFGATLGGPVRHNKTFFFADYQGTRGVEGIADTTTFSASAVNDVRLGFVRDANTLGQPVGGKGVHLASQGFVTGPGTLGIVPLNPQIEGVENVVFNNFTIGLNTTGLTQIDNTFEVSDGFSKVLGAHTIKLGEDFRAIQVNDDPDFIFNGSFSFFGTETGSDFADFLLGIT